MHGTMSREVAKWQYYLAETNDTRLSKASEAHIFSYLFDDVLGLVMYHSLDFDNRALETSSCLGFKV